MLSTWSKKERTYNYKFNQDNDNTEDTELTSYKAEYVWNSLLNKFEKAHKSNIIAKSIVLSLLLLMMSILAFTLTVIIK
jgi:hypothetical protein